MLLRERFECLADLRKRALLAIRRTATAAVVDPTQPAAIAGRNGLGLGGRRWPRTRFADVTACLADQLVAPAFARSAGGMESRSAGVIVDGCSSAIVPLPALQAAA